MRISSPRLRRLDNALAELAEDGDSMLISELDGFLAGLIVAPDPISPIEWLPLVWSSDGTAAPFADEREAQWYVAQVMEHHEAIERALNKGPGRYSPFFEMEGPGGDILWEMWIEAFEAAMRLRPESWAQLAVDGDEDVAEAVGGLITLAEIASDSSDLERDDIDALTAAAPMLIPRWIDVLHAWSSADGNDELPMPSDALLAAKIGRNDPCSCGSGKKYKKCCGLN
jgi:uncharacterized protein